MPNTNEQEFELVEGEEVADEDDSMNEHPEKEEEAAIENVITLDDILKGEDDEENESDDFVDIGVEEKLEQDEEQYRRDFVEGIRKKEQLDQIEKEKNQVNFDEDDDGFIIGLQDAENGGQGASGQGYLDKEKRKADKKNLKFLD